MPVQHGTLILASGSPRRREILGQLGLRFDVRASGVDEPGPDGQSPTRYARGLAELKARAVAAHVAAEEGAAHVLGADTIVVVDDLVLEKPVDDVDAVRMLMRLSGCAHTVITAVAVVTAGSEEWLVEHVQTRVRFADFDEALARRYVASGEGRDKAGSYAMQGLGGGLVRAIEGSHSNVIGLPASETVELLQRAGALQEWP
jgi:septum formation protein